HRDPREAQQPLGALRCPRLVLIRRLPLHTTTTPLFLIGPVCGFRGQGLFSGPVEIVDVIFNIYGIFINGRVREKQEG
ncbi:MAG TPA: hypothetical protein PLA50_03360, partial [Bacteroidia bacterium]|nr:hypothetical protein [Bacteroidia bacterium]